MRKPEKSLRTAAVTTRRRRHTAPRPKTTDEQTAVEVPAAETDTTAAVAEAPAETVVKTRRPRRTRTVASTESDASIETPARRRRARITAPDEAQTDSPDEIAPSSRRRQDDVPPTTRHRSDDETPAATVYKVHLGSFHSRDAADREVRRARTRGFDTQIVPSTRGGRTLYRVQAGAYRDRSHAESIRQEMQDASLDANVSEQRR